MHRMVCDTARMNACWYIRAVAVKAFQPTRTMERTHTRTDKQEKLFFSTVWKPHSFCQADINVCVCVCRIAYSCIHLRYKIRNIKGTQWRLHRAEDCSSRIFSFCFSPASVFPFSLENQIVSVVGMEMDACMKWNMYAIECIAGDSPAGPGVLKKRNKRKKWEKNDKNKKSNGCFYLCTLCRNCLENKRCGISCVRKRT